ncbi:MAG: triose-phosphate isomerase [Bdellovibrionales bacterium]|nr:triose-phosphate isomerase [Bdellovibrionales bacterium]
MSQPFYLIANWKMHFLESEAKALYGAFVEFAEMDAAVKVWVAAPAVHLPILQQVRSGKVPYGAQNVHFELSGAYTGEISVPMVRDCGGTFSLVGHSERRILFHESEELLGKRAEGALRQGLNIVYCVGETLDQRESHQTMSVLENQFATISELVGSYNNGELLIAYEPVWAIGTGRVASTDEIAEAHLHLKTLAAQAGNPMLPVLYGGSVKPQNIEEIATLDDVDGALVGGASLDSDSFRSLYQKSAAALNR